MDGNTKASVPKLDGVAPSATDPPMLTPLLGNIYSFATPHLILTSVQNKAKAISAELLELNFKVMLYNPVIFMNYIVITRDS